MSVKQRVAQTSLLKYTSCVNILTIECTNEHNLMSKSHVEYSQYPQKGIAFSGDQKLKKDFIDLYWIPFEKELEKLIQTAKLRTEQQFDLADRLPEQRELMELQAKCLALTEIWYGENQGNLSRLYLAFHQMCEAANLTRYRWKDIAKGVDHAGYVLIDFKQRDELSKKYKETIIDPYLKQTHFKEGILGNRSVIDNLHKNNFVRAAEAKEIVVGILLKKIILKFLKKRYPDLQNWGQLPAYLKENFLQFVHNRFQHQKGDFAILKRSILQRFLPQRYLAMVWERQISLNNFAADHKEPSIRRQAGSKEQSRIFCNNLPYGEKHGLSLTSSGLHEDLASMHDGSYDLNLHRDEQAFLPNYDLLDFEKMAHEAVLLNPKVASEYLLPGETRFNLGQNPRGAATVPNTQHLQIMAGSLQSCTLFRRVNKPKRCITMDADVDIIQVGSKSDAFFIKFVIDNPLAPSFLLCLSEIRLSMLKAFGGFNEIDFYTHFISQEDGKFAVIFVPFSQNIPNVFFGIANASGNRSIHLSKEHPGNSPISLYDAVAKSGTRDWVQLFFTKKFQADVELSEQVKSLTTFDRSTTNLVMSYM